MKYINYLFLGSVLLCFLLSDSTNAQNIWEPSGIDGGRTNTIVKLALQVMLMQEQCDQFINLLTRE